MLLTKLPTFLLCLKIMPVYFYWVFHKTVYFRPCVGRAKMCLLSKMHSLSLETFERSLVYDCLVLDLTFWDAPCYLWYTNFLAPILSTHIHVEIACCHSSIPYYSLIHARASLNCQILATNEADKIGQTTSAQTMHKDESHAEELIYAVKTFSSPDVSIRLSRRLQINATCGYNLNSIR